MVCLFIVMAIGRFAYTPIMPFMQQTGHMDNQSAGLLATINYLGYLIGAIIPMWLVIVNKVTDLKIYLFINIISTLMMGLLDDFTVWTILRLISGITSGTVFVLASNVALEALRVAKKDGISGLLYSGVGLGIFTSSIFIFIYTSADTWKMTWIVLSLFSLIMGSFVLFGMRENPITENEDSNSSNNTNNVVVKLKKKFIWGFSIAYFCEGAGYIITGTFLVAIVKSIPELADYAALSWMFVGLGAIPSTILWSMMANKLGHAKAIYLAFILQIIAVVLPVFSGSMMSLVISSLFFGATFLGLTTLFMSKAQTLMFESASKINLVASLTVIYSLGQMIAPAFSGVLIGESGNYNAALIFAAVILCIGLLSSFYSYRVTD
ncbi:YbfB/YjiJ family MFS transporter [Staphylococcus saprophyticus]|uniref:YbfB/YjiJ family MFS transporter n=1 Tax=Staphylococcus saprophyticus TaxID=29385 RepID=UPI0015FFDBEE|nr:YbfB/YjiJ family MFS transporter [Staphylococcus saprophyticus]MDW3940706.1 YbfB/YjiJ family MFS transporter [Staphylococcus saprophyticus]MDW4041089.1 YbfB/YjiJ family MFS transporter [Staphylococcus saprophyticus]MDW4186961.1 YbfB/YjiJ family MFS transporter [Staphylococcus saprophyticus]MDW4214227.1 YbfB/YjiJ family MFS transporter [Staphylococcus saprophyticus]MDW4229168.1 YbfB/YjiJ family MFS transporter [Staphylococcus saprophyticus]